MTRIRPDVVALLADVVVDFAVPPDTWRRNDGTALTEDEINQVLSATIEEACAVLAYGQAVIERYEQRAADIARAEQLARPYMAQLGSGASLDAVLKLMPEGPERDEFVRLAEQLAGLDDNPGDSADG